MLRICITKYKNSKIYHSSGTNGTFWANDDYGGPAGQCLSRRAARAGTAADRFQVSLSPALGLARILGAGPAKGGAEASRGGPLAPGENTPLREQACNCRQARGGAWGVLTCLFACYLVSLGYPLDSLWFPLETVRGTEMFSFRPAAHFRGCLHACSWPCLFA